MSLTSFYNDKKVVVGMSGGIDSSVAAFMLQREGYEVIGVTLKHLPDELSELPGKTCCSLDDINDARYTCYKLGIPHYVLNVTEEFKKEVIDYFIQMYSEGKTPSPCVICDEKVKIKKIVDFANKMGIKYIATGHYSSISKNNLLMWESDNRKDQSYMLYRLDKEIMNRFLFPLSGYKKEEIRKIAKENGIHTHSKPDSQGICFAPKGYIDFLEKVLNEKVIEGNFVDINGNVLGKHRGYQFYTVGQRRGLGLNLGKPYFILKIIPEKNEIVVGDFELLKLKTIEVKYPKLHYDLNYFLGKKIIARPRFSSKGLNGELKKVDGKLLFVFDEPTHENSEGQHIVFYFENEVIGGGEISFIN